MLVFSSQKWVIIIIIIIIIKNYQGDIKIEPG